MKYLKFLLVALVSILAVGSVVTPAQAATTSISYVYNNPVPNSSSPRCSPDDHGPCSLMNRLVADIKATPCNGRIDVVSYSLGNPDERLALVNRAACGTTIRFMTSRQKPDGEDEGVEPDGEMKLLISQLKKYPNAKTMVGWGALARGGKHGKDYAKGKDSKGIQHEKIVLIDNGKEQLTESDSGNGTYALDTDYNDRLRINDRCMYSGMMKHLDRLWLDRDIKHEDPVKTCDGKNIAYFMPAYHGDPVLSYLKKAKCGSGSLIDFGNFYFAGGKADDYADEIIRLHKSKAKVRIAANANFQHWSDYQKRRFVSEGITVYDMTVYVNKRLKYNHRKELDTIGCSGGSFGSQGSTTINKTAYESNGNQIITTSDANTVKSMHQGFDVMTNDKHVFTLVDVGCRNKDGSVPKKLPSGCKKG